LKWARENSSLKVKRRNREILETVRRGKRGEKTTG